MVAGDATPLLQTGSASIGQVVDRRRLEDLPLADGNPFILARVAPGVAFTDVNNLRFTRPFDNGGTSSISANGVGSQASEFTLDGLPDNAAFGRQIAYVPPAEAVHEFKVVTTSFDAQQGHSAGAHVDVVTRSGTNRGAGSAYWFNRHEALAANEFFVNANPNCERDADGGCRKNPLRYNRWGGTFGGPVMLPGPSGVWSGKDRLFFFAAYEGLRQTTPATNTFTVPTEAMRNGDFSALLPDIGIYDPATAFVRPDGRVERLPFAGNIIPPDRIDAIGRNYLSYWPLPNLPCTDAQCRNNLTAPVPRTDHFYSVSIRADAALNQQHRLFGRFSHNRRKQHTEGWSGVINGVDPTTSDSFRINDSLAIDHVYTASPGWLLNVRGGLTRFESKGSRAAEGVFDAATLGFPPATTASSPRPATSPSSTSPISIRTPAAAPSAAPSRVDRCSTSTRSSRPSRACAGGTGSTPATTSASIAPKRSRRPTPRACTSSMPARSRRGSSAILPRRRWDRSWRRSCSACRRADESSTTRRATIS